MLYYGSMSLPLDSKYIRLISSRLRNFKQKNDYLWNFSCPLCGDSKTNLTKARGYVFQKGNSLFYRCHNCGAGTNLSNLLKNVDPSLHDEYVMERFKSGETNTSPFKAKVVKVSAFRFDKVEKQKVFEHAEWVDKLPEGHFCLDYCKKRNLPKESLSKLLFTQHYKQFLDAAYPNHGHDDLYDDARLVIPYYDENSELIAFSGRALEKASEKLRYVTIRTNDSKKKLIYGLDRVNRKQTIKIVEGPIDSLFLKNTIASGDANLKLCADELKTDDVVLIFDNEPRNKEICKLILKAINSKYRVVIWPSTTEGKDINEMILAGKTVSEIEDIISSNTFRNIEAQLKFNMWKKIQHES
jgi:transcription elongation factor Elf1